MLRCTDIRPAPEQVGRQAGRQLRQWRLRIQPGHFVHLREQFARQRRADEQHQLIHVLAHLPRKGCHARLRRIEGGLRLSDILRRRRAMGELQLCELQRIRLGGGGFLGHLQRLAVREPSIITRGNLRDEADLRGELRIGIAEISLLRRLCLTADLAEQIELPRHRAGADAVFAEIFRRTAVREIGRDTLALHGRRGVDHGEEIGAVRSILRLRLLHIEDGDAQVAIILQAQGNEGLQGGIAEKLVPAHIRGGGAGSRGTGTGGPVGGDGRRRALIGGDEAAAAKQTQQQGGNGTPHHSALPVSMAAASAASSERRLTLVNVSTTTKKTGTKNTARMVALSMPPTTAVPMAMRLAAPAPVATASGNVPKMKAIEVMRMGRNRSCAACKAASAKDAPCSKKARANSTMRMAFLVASPMVVNSPTWKYTPLSSPRNSVARMAPMMPSGMTRITAAGIDQLS